MGRVVEPNNNGDGVGVKCTGASEAEAIAVAPPAGRSFRREDQCLLLQERHEGLELQLDGRVAEGDTLGRSEGNTEVEAVEEEAIGVQRGAEVDDLQKGSGGGGVLI